MPGDLRDQAIKLLFLNILVQDRFDNYSISAFYSGGARILEQVGPTAGPEVVW